MLAKAVIHASCDPLGAPCTRSGQRCWAVHITSCVPATIEAQRGLVDGQALVDPKLLAWTRHLRATQAEIGKGADGLLRTVAHDSSYLLAAPLKPGSLQDRPPARSCVDGKFLAQYGEDVFEARAKPVTAKRKVKPTRPIRRFCPKGRAGRVQGVWR
jgi:hypothetical protein